MVAEAGLHRWRDAQGFVDDLILIRGNPKGKFSPHASSELYLHDLKLLIVIAAEENLFGAKN